MTPERLDWHLDNWSKYMQRDTHKLGYPAKSLCMSGGGASGDDEFDIMCDEADINCAQRMDGIIDSISQPQRVAVNHVWLQVGHHYPTHELDYEEAIVCIDRLANKRGLI